MSFSEWPSLVIQKVCDVDPATALGLKPWTFALIESLAYVLFFFAVYRVWKVAKRKYNSNGFSDAVWRAWIGIFGGFTFLQIASSLAQPLLERSLCPYDQYFTYGSVLLAILCLYFYHLGTGNKGSYTKYISFVAVPMVTEVFATRTYSGLRLAEGAFELLMDFYRLVFNTVLHVASLT